MKSKDIVKEIAKCRISRLLELAYAMARQNTEQSRQLEKRYVRLARLISAHYKVKIPKEQEQRICKSCNNLLVPGINCTVRLASGRKYLAYRCECGAERHVFMPKKQRASD
ncbi:MAG: hypothetical protein QXT43_02025 [Candidatus Micrarchaeaceae archaeon]